MPFIETNGIKMHYEEKGEGDPLILIMGFGAPGALWELHVNEYSKHFRCIMIDNRGVGQTDQPPGPYLTSTMADDTAAAAQAARTLFGQKKSKKSKKNKRRKSKTTRRRKR